MLEEVVVEVIEDLSCVVLENKKNKDSCSPDGAARTNRLYILPRQMIYTSEYKVP
jgi:hypothetical protein